LLATEAADDATDAALAAADDATFATDAALEATDAADDATEFCKVACDAADDATDAALLATTLSGYKAALLDASEAAEFATVVAALAFCDETPADAASLIAPSAFVFAVSADTSAELADDVAAINDVSATFDVSEAAVFAEAADELAVDPALFVALVALLIIDDAVDLTSDTALEICVSVAVELALEANEFMLLITSDIPGFVAKLPRLSAKLSATPFSVVTSPCACATARLYAS
jgi:hypothetical protein